LHGGAHKDYFSYVSHGGEDGDRNMVPSGGNDVRFWDQHGDRSSRGVQTSQSQALDVDHRVNDYDRPILDEFKGNLGRWGIPRAVANKLATWFRDRRGLSFSMAT
jgi:hypothetical protein